MCESLLILYSGTPMCESLGYRHFVYNRLSHSHRKGDILGKKELKVNRKANVWRKIWSKYRIKTNKPKKKPRKWEKGEGISPIKEDNQRKWNKTHGNTFLLWEF